jgi:hypothetical protein
VGAPALGLALRLRPPHVAGGWGGLAGLRQRLPSASCCCPCAASLAWAAGRVLHARTRLHGALVTTMRPVPLFVPVSAASPRVPEGGISLIAGRLLAVGSFENISRGWPVSRPAWERLPPGTGVGEASGSAGGTTEWARAVRGKGRLIFLYSRQFMSVIILMADRVLDSSRHKEVMNAKQRHLVAPEVVRFLG